MQRRALILGAALMLPAAVLAHDGHGAMEVDVVIAEAVAAGAAVRLAATLTNYGVEDIAVTGLSAAGAEVSSTALPRVIPAAGSLSLAADLVFDGAAPGIFSLEIAFGDEGSGPVLVMPTLKGENDV